ncbi:MAG TPA: DoxX family protein [Noviherbaspirillum sp.]|jgi:uncharacterized membrane protein YphA (DoxX/SURF4 family)|uniref:DoxX family protein n=1 Tax=Noviherbaspirillum sp. TaxID=1926288 RepID=UPI002F94EED4
MATVVSNAAPGKGIRITLWVAQFIVAAMFIMSGFMKLFTPIPELAQMMPWAGQYPTWFVRGIALVDLAGGIGILLPALTRIKPNLTVFAALGCAVLQVFAIVFHLSRGEAMVVPVNVVLLGLSVFVFWGRSRKAPILPRN